MAAIIADLNWLASVVEADGGGAESGGPFREYLVVQEAIREIERLRGIIRSCQHGTEVTDLGDGELIGLYRPNKEESHD